MLPDTTQVLAEIVKTVPDSLGVITDSVRIIIMGVSSADAEFWTTERLSLIAAIVAIVVGPFAAIYIGTRKIKAQVLSGNRQQWINTLRDNIAEVISILGILTAHRGKKILGNQQIVEKAERTVHIKSKISLLINPEEKDHKKLSNLINKAAAGLNKAREEHSWDDFSKLQNKIIKLSQSILKREWERVKKVK